MIIDFDSKNKGGGKEPVVEALNVTANGSYNAPSGVDGFTPVNVNVPQREPVLESLSVTDNGTYTPSAGKDGFDSVDVNVPKEHHNVVSKSITANGTYNSDGDDVWNEVSVNVLPKLETLNATDNGTYTPSVGKDGFDSVEVNVPKEHHNVVSKSITANGTYNSTGDEVWNEVSVNVPQKTFNKASVTKEYTANGQYSIETPDGYDGISDVNLTVNVPERVPVLESLSVTDNGTYTPESGVDGYNSVSVNVQKEHHNVTSKSITENGVYNSTGDEVWNEVSVNVPQSGGGGFDTTQLSQLQIRQNLDTVDLTGLDTRNVRSMKNMFFYCESKTLDLSHLNTSNVEDFGSMFIYSSLTTLDLSNFDTSRANSFTKMFYSCRNLTSLNISNWNMSRGKYLAGMFEVCSSLTTIISDGLQLPDIDLSNIELSDMRLDWCPLTVDSIVGLLNALPQSTNNYSFKIGTDNIAKLSDDQKAIATNKGWTLV